MKLHVVGPICYDFQVTKETTPTKLQPPTSMNNSQKLESHLYNFNSKLNFIVMFRVLKFTGFSHCQCLMIIRHNHFLHPYPFSLSLFPVPESHFKLNYRTDHDGMVQIKCSAFNVYPEPKLTLKYDLSDSKHLLQVFG